MQIGVKFTHIRIVIAIGLIMLTGIWLIRQFQPMRFGVNRGWSPIQIIMRQDHFYGGLFLGVALGCLWAIAIQFITEKGMRMMKSSRHSTASVLVSLGIFILVGMVLWSRAIVSDSVSQLPSAIHFVSKTPLLMGFVVSALLAWAFLLLFRPGEF